MSAKHTPGPWYVVDLHHRPWTDALTIGSDPEGLTAIAHTTRGFEGDGTEGSSHAWANARLIAAAPDLLASLIALRDYVSTGADADGDSCDKWLDRASAAIAKATGAA